VASPTLRQLRNLTARHDGKGGYFHRYWRRRSAVASTWSVITFGAFAAARAVRLQAYPIGSATTVPSPGQAVFATKKDRAAFGLSSVPRLARTFRNANFNVRAVRSIPRRQPVAWTLVNASPPAVPGRIVRPPRRAPPTTPVAMACWQGPLVCLRVTAVAVGGYRVPDGGLSGVATSSRSSLVRFRPQQTPFDGTVTSHRYAPDRGGAACVRHFAARFPASGRRWERSAAGWIRTRPIRSRSTPVRDNWRW
jgi:hypothetical protein